MKSSVYSILAVLTILQPGSVFSKELVTIGWLEKVSLQPSGFVMRAKIDTGADNSSVDAADWSRFQRDGKDWIRFTVRNNDGDSQSLEAPLVRFAQIKRKGADPLTRPVVNLTICLAHHQYTVPINLADRGSFQYRMLIGRSALSEKFLVDSGAKWSTPPNCR